MEKDKNLKRRLKIVEFFSMAGFHLLVIIIVNYPVRNTQYLLRLYWF